MNLGKKLLKNSSLPEEKEALFEFNECCMNVKSENEHSYEYPMDNYGLIRIRLTALKIFMSKYLTYEKHLSLLNSLIESRPHWEQYLTPINGNVKDLIIKFFMKCCNPCLSEYDLESFTIKEDSRWYDGKNPQKSYLGREKPILDHCIVHPNRKSTNKKRNLCSSCTQRLYRLNLHEYEMDLGLIYILKVKLGKKGSPFNPEMCVNHKSKIALGNGLCEICNNKIGNLEYMFGQQGINIKDFNIKWKESTNDMSNM
uniref:Uncharacterized protein n=1 Tax=viral metagenome TaxID=1070528 RepID=A0A6M3K303_9ZZZZ